MADKKTSIALCAQWQTIYETYLSTKQKRGESEGLPLKQKTQSAMKAVHRTETAHEVAALVESTLSEGQSIWAWSDQHFFHKNIIEYGERPFQDMSEMLDVMRHRYHECVKPNDIVLFGGDVAFGALTQANDFLRGWPGRKVLVLGNHEFAPDYRKYPHFEWVVMSFAFEWDGRWVGVSHLPVGSELLPERWINLHGHTHQRKVGPRHVNMAVECTDYKPRLFVDLLT
jgi:calcineurin-like phosphoesterase family protein